jgi:hypothetical protein
MRRALLGGLGIALGVLGRPALAQYEPGRPAVTSNRAASLGRPEAVVPTTTADPGVTPVGLVARGQAPPAVVSGPVPVFGPVAPSQSGATPLPQPRTLGQQPSVTEIRDANGSPFQGNGVPADNPGMVPSVGPGGTAFPTVSPDDPLYGTPAPGMGAITRVSGNNKWWVSGEYLLWWTKSTQLPVLAATGPATGAVIDNGFTVIPPPGVPVLSGSFGQTLHGGARFGAGYWFGDNQCRGVDTRFLFLFRNGTSFNTNTNEFPVLGRPFSNVNTPVGPSADIIGFPGVAIGGMSVETENSLWGAEVNYRRHLFGGVCNPCFRLDGLVGFRYLNFKEQLTITETGIIPAGSPLLLTGRAPFATATDQFKAENNFYGGQVGLVGEVNRGRWFVNGRATVALGSVLQSAEINGGQVTAAPGGPVTASAGGLLALPGANIGTFTQNKFAVLPEAGLNIGYQVTPRMRVFVGYDFLYLSSVVRPANLVDTNIDAARVPNFFTTPPAVLPGAPQPAPVLRTTDFFAQGINFGMTWTW